MEHTKHLWRAGLILLAVTVVAIVGRHFLIPSSFGDHGFYRYDSLGEFMAKPAIHGGAQSCEPCHADQAKARKEGKHASVSCEICHAPAAKHAEGDVKVADMPVDRSYILCAYCHRTLRARPESMPQVDPVKHLMEMEVIAKGEAIPEGACGACHDVHSPSVD